MKRLRKIIGVILLQHMNPTKRLLFHTLFDILCLISWIIIIKLVYIACVMEANLGRMNRKLKMGQGI